MTKTYPELMAEGITRTIFTERRGGNKRFIVYHKLSCLMGNADMGGATDIDESCDVSQTHNLDDLKKLPQIMKKLEKDYDKFLKDNFVVNEKFDPDDDEFHEFVSFYHNEEPFEMEPSELKKYWGDFLEYLAKDSAAFGVIIDSQDKKMYQFFIGTTKPREWARGGDGYGEMYKVIKSSGMPITQQFDFAEREYSGKAAPGFRMLNAAVKKSWIGKVR